MKDALLLSPPLEPLNAIVLNVCPSLHLSSWRSMMNTCTCTADARSKIEFKELIPYYITFDLTKLDTVHSAHAHILIHYVNFACSLRRGGYFINRSTLDITTITM